MDEQQRHDLTIAGYDPYRDSEGYYFDFERGNRVIEFAEKYLVHAVGKWVNTPLTLTDWQRRLILNLFGWVSIETGLRRYKELFFTCARKAGKTTLVSIIAWWMLCCDDEQPRCYLVANSKEQASDGLWDVIVHQYESNPALSKRYRRKGDSIVAPSRNGYMRLLSGGGRGGNKHGGSPSLVIFDEQSWSTKQDIHTALSSGFGARDQGIWVSVSTVSHITDNIFAETLEHAKRVRDGVVKDSQLLPVIFQMPNEGEEVEHEGEKIKVTWHDKRLWHLANPNLDIGLPTDLDTLYEKALKLPSYANEFRMTKLNQVVASETVWLPIHEWDKGQQKYNGYPENLADYPCAIGVDLSTSHDITSWAATWWIDDVLHIRPFYFIPKENITERERLHKVTYTKWKEDGAEIEFTEGNSVDFPAVVESILQFCETHNVETIYYDRYKWTSVISALLSQGKDCVAHGQHCLAMNSPCQEFQRLVETYQVNCPCPIFRWMLSHTSIYTDKEGHIKTIKPEHKDHKKIDGVQAALMTINHHTAIKEKVIDFALPARK